MLWEIWFWLTLPLIVLLDGLSTLIGMLGGGAPIMESLQRAKGKWKLLFGHKIVKQDMDCINGYLYYKYVFDDNSVIFLR